MKKFLCSILAILFILTLFTACKDENITQTPETSAPDSETKPPVVEETPTPEILIENLSNYRITRADGCGSEIATAVIDLVDAISETHGITLPKGDDFYKEGYNTISEFEILVGKTNRPESKEFLSNLKCDDYGYEMVGQKLVIAGHTPEMTVKAVEHFIENVLGEASETVFFSNESQFIYIKNDYPADIIKINEVNISEYVIVYPYFNKNNEKTFATMLQSKIMSMSGFYLSIDTDKNSSSDRYEIIIGGDSQNIDEELRNAAKELEDGKYLLTAKGKNVLLASKTNAGMMNAIDTLIAGLTPENGKKDSNYMLGKSTPSDISEKEFLSTMSFNVYVGNITQERIDRVIEMIIKYMPDTFGVQEATEKWITSLASALPDYAYVGEGRDGGGNKGEYSAVFYRKDKFTLLDGGTKWLSDTPDVKGSKYEESNCVRIMSYAVLERKSDGSRFIHVNTHLDHVSSTAREKQTKVLLQEIGKLPDYPVILTGDFNCNSSSAPYNQILDGFNNASKKAEVTEDSATYHGYAGKTSIIDFIFFEKGTSFIVNLYKVCNEQINGDFASDHHPIYSEYIFAK